MTTLAEPIQMSLPAVSKHLRVLEQAGLVQRRRQGREHVIGMDADGIQEAQGWIRQYIQFWESRFDAVDELLQKSRGKKSS